MGARRGGHRACAAVRRDGVGRVGRVNKKPQRPVYVDLFITVVVILVIAILANVLAAVYGW